MNVYVDGCLRSEENSYRGKKLTELVDFLIYVRDNHPDVFKDAVASLPKRSKAPSEEVQM